MRRILLACCAVVIGWSAMACGGSAPAGAARPGDGTAPGGVGTTCGSPPEGSATQLQTPTGDGTRFGAPELRWNPLHDANEASIEVRGVAGGSRTITFQGGGCTTLPEPASAGCPTIEAGALTQETEARLRAQGVTQLNGLGAGIGATTTTLDVRSWRFGLGVTRWADADAAIATMARVLDDYAVTGSLWISVRGIACAQAASR